MKSWSVILMLAVIFSCSDEKDPVPVAPEPLLEDLILGNWQFATATLIDEKGSIVTTNIRSEFCKLVNHPLSQMVRQIDIRLLKDNVNLAIVATNCAENDGTYTLTFDDSNFTTILRPDSILTHNGVGIPMYKPNWKVKKVTGIELEMYRIAPEENDFFDASGYKMIYSFKRK